MVMYHFPYFKESDQNMVRDLTEKYPFAFLTGSYLNGKQVATQVPLLLEERNGRVYLQGHIMRNTDHHKAFIENPQVLAVFTGPNAYVSATWYTQPSGGSTWNYMSVHAQGAMRFLNDHELRELMQKFTLKFENGQTDSPTVFNNLPEDYNTKMLAAIVGFEIAVEQLDNTFKLSQNRDVESFRNIITHLEKQGGDAALIAAEMKKRKSKMKF